MKLNVVLMVFVCAMMSGCPVEGSSSACDKKVMVCETDTEMYCDKNLNGCGKNCHYYVIESCWEKCDEGGRLGEVDARGD